MRRPNAGTSNNAHDALLNEVILAVAQVCGRSGGNAPLSIRPDAFLGADLGLSSIAVARLVGILQKRCGRGPLPFHKMFTKSDGTMIQDVRVSDVAAFLEQHLQTKTP